MNSGNNQPKKQNRILSISHNNNGALISNFTYKINIERKYTYFSDINEELKKQLGGKQLPKISLNVIPYIDELPKSFDSNTRIVILDKIDMTDIVLEETPSHIVLIYTSSTKIQDEKLQLFSLTQFVRSIEEIDDICYEVYFDIFMYHFYHLDLKYSGNKNKEFNALKIKFVADKFKISLDGQKYVSLYHFATGKNLVEKVKSGIKLWKKFIAWLKFYTEPKEILFDSIQSEKLCSADSDTISQCVNNMNNPNHLNYVLDDIFLNHPYAKQLSREKLKQQLLQHYDYPCCLVRIIKKPKNTSVRKKLAAQMSIPKFKCGRNKIVKLENLTKYEKFFDYLHIYMLK